MVTIKRYDDGEFLKRLLGKILSQTLSKITSAAARGDDATEVVIGVYDIMPSSYMRAAYYSRKKLEVAQPTEPVMPYIIRRRAVEAAIVRMLFAHAATGATMERHK